MATTNDESVGRNRIVSSALHFCGRLVTITDFRCVFTMLVTNWKHAYKPEVLLFSFPSYRIVACIELT